MKLPTLDSASDRVQSVCFSDVHANGHAALQGVEMNNIFGDIFGGLKDIVVGGIGKIPCILSKAGPQGIACFTKCGPNPGCLAACAGPSVLSSIMSCI